MYWVEHKETCRDVTQQPVCYMKHIQLSPTKADVVKETLMRSQVVAEKCGQKYASVIYDLAIGKIAKRIQC